MLSKYFKISLIFTLVGVFILNSCSGAGDARKRPPNVKDRIQKNIEEGRGVKIMGNKQNIGEFDFASSNELWRASLDTLDFMPLALANYSGGVIVTDWYSDSNESNSTTGTKKGERLAGFDKEFARMQRIAEAEEEERAKKS